MTNRDRRYAFLAEPFPNFNGLVGLKMRPEARVLFAGLLAHAPDIADGPL